MRLDITGRHVEITPAVRQLLARRLARLERMLNDAALSAIITLSKEKYRLRTEIAVHTKGDHVLRGMAKAMRCRSRCVWPPRRSSSRRRSSRASGPGASAR